MKTRTMKTTSGLCFGLSLFACLAITTGGVEASPAKPERWGQRPQQQYLANSTSSWMARTTAPPSGTSLHVMEFDYMVEEATRNGRISDPIVRQGLIRYYSKIQILRINGLRSLTQTLNGTKDMGVISLGLTNKMFWSEMHRDAMELALEIFGAASMLADTGPESGGWPAVMRGAGRPTYKPSPMMSSFFFSRSETIWGGTAEIQRNIVGERVLGLPGEPKPVHKQ